MAKIVLCSASPRRQELLRHIGVSEFDIRIPNADESVPAGLTPRQTVEHISRQKALAARTLCAADEICITADTIRTPASAPKKRQPKAVIPKS